MASSKKVTIIANYGSEGEVSDGGRIKVRLYANLLKKNGIQVNIIDLDGWKYKILQTISKIRRAIKNEDVIVIMAGPKGCRVIIPLVNRLNKKKKVRTVFCPLGIGALDSLLKPLDQEQVIRFLNCESFFSLQDEKMGSELAKLDLVAPENERLMRVYTEFYKLSNLRLLPNYRDEEVANRAYSVEPGTLRIIYASRICESKGIFDLMKAVKELDDLSYGIKLDIYGEMQLSGQEKAKFESFMSSNIAYRGIAKFAEMIDLMKKYDLFCLPTKYYGEGTSGALVESFIAGTPALVSSYSQANLLVNDGVDGFIYRIGDVEDLKDKILSVYRDKAKLEAIGKAAQEKAKSYLFEYNKETFFEAILGRRQ